MIQIGTFSERKNQCFSLEVLNEIIKKGYKASLTFIGYTFDDSKYKNKMDELIQCYDLWNYVKFRPKDADVPMELSEADYMLLPSLREGLPNVALESQAMGIPCFLSDNITRATDCGLCIYLSLQQTPKYWANQIISYRQKNGIEKRFIDMSEWDNAHICSEYLKIWRGKETEC